MIERHVFGRANLDISKRIQLDTDGSSVATDDDVITDPADYFLLRKCFGVYGVAQRRPDSGR